MVTIRAAPSRILSIVFVLLVIAAPISTAAIRPDPDGTSMPDTAIDSPGATSAEPSTTLSAFDPESNYRWAPNTSDSGPAVADDHQSGQTVGGLNDRSSDSIAHIAYDTVEDWTEYSVEVKDDGNYTVVFRVDAPAISSRKSTVVLTVDGAPSASVTVPRTGRYQAYETVSASLPLSSGTHVIRLTYRTGHLLIDWFEVVRKATRTASRPALISVSKTLPSAVPIAIPPASSPSPSPAERRAEVDAARTAGNARLEGMRAAYLAWKIPPRPDLTAIATDVRKTGDLKSDGTTDNTEALQSLIDSSPADATLFFPAGTYRIDGPIEIPKPLTLVGETGTVLDCQGATQYVFNLNRAGSSSTRMGGMTITGFVIEGPGIETTPAMIAGYYLRNVRLSYIRFHNIGYAAIQLKGCVDATVEDCVFDTVFKKGYGYGVTILEYSDGVVINNSFFVTKGRHGVAVGAANNALPVAGYVKRVTVEDNYFENFTDQAIDAHDETTGPYVVRRNVIVNSRVGINFRHGIADISDNVIINCSTGILLRNQGVDTANTESRADRVVGNTIIGASTGVQVEKPDSLVQDNVQNG